MTVAAETPINTYTANGSTAVFAYTFRIEDASELQIYIDTVLQSTGFTISGVGDNGGGSVTFSSNPANGAIILLLREMPSTRTIDYQNSGDFRAVTINEDLDRVWLKVQELERELDYRTLQFPKTEIRPSPSVINALPSPSTNQVMRWDVDGSLKNSPIEDLVTSINLNSTFDRYDSMAAFLAAAPSSAIVYVTSYYGGWTGVDGPKGGAFWHKTNATAASPTVGSAVTGYSPNGKIGGVGNATSTYTGDHNQAGYAYDANGNEWAISLYIDGKIVVDVTKFGAKNDGTANQWGFFQDAVTFAGSFFDGAAIPRRSALDIYAPYGHYKVEAPIVFSFGAGEFSACRVFGDSRIDGTIIEGTHAGNIFEYPVGEWVEIDHLTFRGAGCSAIRQTNLTYYTTYFHIHHCNFDASLYECLYFNLILSHIEYNTFGYFGTPTAGNHRHIYCNGDPAGFKSNLNRVSNNRFYKASTSYAIDIRTGENWLFEHNNYETNFCPIFKISGVLNVYHFNDWFENNAVTTLGSTPYEYLVQDDGILYPRSIVFENCHLSPQATHTHFINATSASNRLSIKVRNSVATSIPAGFVFTKYNGVNDGGIVEWIDNTFVGYSHNNFDVSKYQNDAFATYHSGADIANVTGDGTAYDMVFNVIDYSHLGTFSSTTHTAANTGRYDYFAEIRLGGILSGHTDGVISLVTTGGTYSKYFNPANMANGSGIATISESWGGISMTALDTAKLTLTISGSTLVVDVKENSTRFSCHRVLNT